MSTTCCRNRHATGVWQPTEHTQHTRAHAYASNCHTSPFRSCPLLPTGSVHIGQPRRGGSQPSTRQAAALTNNRYNNTPQEHEIMHFIRVGKKSVRLLKCEVSRTVVRLQHHINRMGRLRVFRFCHSEGFNTTHPLSFDCCGVVSSG